VGTPYCDPTRLRAEPLSTWTLAGLERFLACISHRRGVKTVETITAMRGPGQLAAGVPGAADGG
jgi:hypothetical protein